VRNGGLRSEGAVNSTMGGDRSSVVLRVESMLGCGPDDFTHGTASRLLIPSAIIYTFTAAS
jgi:hypothetical protein